MQYTIRRIPPALDAALRRRARTAGTSLNQAALEALADGLGMNGERPARRDLSDIAGTWTKERAIETALAAQNTVDEELWR